MQYFDEDKYPPNLEYNTNGEGTLETYSPDINIVLDILSKDKTKVWTIMENDDNNLVICAGFHLINRLQYYISTESWTDVNEEYMWCDFTDLSDTDYE